MVFLTVEPIKRQTRPKGGDAKPQAYVGVHDHKQAAKVQEEGCKIISQSNGEVTLDTAAGLPDHR